MPKIVAFSTYRRAASRALPLTMQSKLLIVSWNSLWEWLPGDWKGLELRLKLELCSMTNHYMAFAKTPKRIRIAVLSARFKIGLKYRVKKSQKFPISCPTTCQESNPGVQRKFQPPWPISQTLRSKNAVFRCIWNHSVLQNSELSFSNGRNSISRYFFSQNPKCWIVLFQYTNVYLCAKFGDLKPTIDENQRPQIWTLFPSKVKKQHSARKLRFSFDQMFHK